MLFGRGSVCFGVALLYLAHASGQKPNWQNLDLVKDSVFGASTEKAYRELLKDKKPAKVVVAIVDSGIDTAQEDLKSVLWTDARNGSHGWNYIGQETGQEDITKLVGTKRGFYDSLSYTMVPEVYREGYQSYRKLTPQLGSKINAMKDLVSELTGTLLLMDDVVGKIGKEDPEAADFKSYQPANEEIREIVNRVLKRLFLYPGWKAYREQEIMRIIESSEFHIAHGLNPGNSEPDTAAGDSDIYPDRLGPVKDPNLTAYHGTHVAGTIGAVRNNGTGVDGIADNVEIMMLKANGNIRELRDASLAKAIRFAVDHGAKVINLSFGKPYTWNKTAVDAAVAYAMGNDVVLVHAAGNSGDDLDQQDHFPNPVYQDGSGIARAWIEVGASGTRNDSTLAAPFSNYGKQSVDLFAPGIGIYSTLPFNQYASWSGTSMAAPVVTGIAALIREYYPKLTAVQVKDIILLSVIKSNYLTDKCGSGGVVNAYNALKMAAAFSGKN